MGLGFKGLGFQGSAVFCFDSFAVCVCFGCSRSVSVSTWNILEPLKCRFCPACLGLRFQADYQDKGCLAGNSGEVSKSPCWCSSPERLKYSMLLGGFGCWILSEIGVGAPGLSKPASQ